MKDKQITCETAKLAYRKDYTWFHAPLPSLIFDDEYLPTQSLLQKWLRDENMVSVEPYYWGGVYNIRVINENNTILFDNARGECGDSIPGAEGWDSYEEALEVGLEKALERL